MRWARIADRIAKHWMALLLAVVTLAIGLFAGPFVNGMLNDYVYVSPQRLASLLENRASVVQLVLTNSEDGISSFNKIKRNS